MKTALWENSAGALAALLNSGAPLDKADLYALTLASGAVYRWSGSDIAIAGNGHTWALGPGLKRSKVKFSVGVAVDMLTIDLTDNVGTVINGLALIPFIRAGGLIGATLQLDRAFWTAGDTAPRGALLWFSGRVADIPVLDRYGAQINIASELEVLDTMVPRDVYQTGCLNTLFDAACGASRATFTFTGAASSATDALRVTFSHTLSQAAGYFDLGVITMTSGANAGVSRTVRTQTTGQVSVLNPWPSPVASGDTFSIVAGCNKSQTDANGCSKFHTSGDVILRFRGHPYVPVPEIGL
jgi:uncharacterized phage protein (TIGR02218 family)